MRLFGIRPVFSAFLSLCCLLTFFSASALADYGGEPRTTTLDGQAVYYEVAGKAEAPAVVFVHGWSCDGSFWKHQIPYFAADYRVIVLDLPGFGKSAKPENVDYTMAYLARGVKAVMDANGLRSAVLVGHSMGYPVVRQFLIDNPGMVRAVVNVEGAYYRVPGDAAAKAAWRKEMDEFLADFTGPKREEAVKLFIEDTFYGQTPEVLRPEIAAVMLSAAPHVANSTMKAMGEMEQWADQTFFVPTLAIYATTSVLPEAHEKYLRTIFPRLVYEEWPEAGHYLMLEQPDRFNESLGNFLKSLSNVRVPN